MKDFLVLFMGVAAAGALMWLFFTLARRWFFPDTIGKGQGISRRGRKPATATDESGTIVETAAERDLWNQIFRDDGEEGTCPACGSRGFYAGPEGGMSQNVHCRNVACRTNINLTPVLELAEVMGRRGFDWYEDGPDKDAAVLAMLQATEKADTSAAAVYHRRNHDHPLLMVQHVPDGYGWAVVTFASSGHPMGIQGGFKDQAHALAAIHGPSMVEIGRRADKRRSLESGDRKPAPDEPLDHFTHGMVMGAILSDPGNEYKAPGEPLKPAGGSFGGGGASGAWEDRSASVSVPAAVAGAAAVMSHAAPARPYEGMADVTGLAGPDRKPLRATMEEPYSEAVARAIGTTIEASVSADASPSYSSDSGSSSSYDSGSSGGGDSGGGGGGD